MYTIGDLGSSGFKETTSVMIHPTVSYSVHHNNCVAMNYSWRAKMVDHGITKISLSVTPRLDVLPKRGSRFYMVKVTGRQLRIFCLKFSIMGFFWMP